ncbi:MAG: hypothetical protein OEZ40_06310, partial [Candidatus Bathyarchaeota archaeon]|nr:hypothetical protein [Candidatus Bathyarchaeota archaeon]
RLAKLAYFKEILYAPGEEWKKKYLQDQLEYYRKQGMSIDLDRAEIHIRTTTSWMIASARFGSPSIEGRPLLSMGDVTRYRWRCFIPSEQERFQITSEVGGLPPETVSGTEKRSCCEAWKVLISALRKNVVDGSVMVPRDEASFQSRKEIWNQTVREMTDLYGEKMSEVYLEQLVNLRTRAEFTRIMYQHAALKQFERSQGYDFVLPSKFIINYDEDGEFARQLWLSEYVPSMMSVIDDITHFAHSWRGRRIATSTQRGEEIILKRLEKGPADHGELEKLVREAGITASLLNNYILPGLIRKGLICKPTGYKLYRVRDCKNCQYRETCPHKENENQRSAGGGLHG